MPSPECEKFAGKLRKYKNSDPVDLQKSRAFVDQSSEFFTLPETVTCTPVDVDGIPVELRKHVLKRSPASDSIY
ncbi:MAG TPA: hypothetical protein EYN96_01930 [Candidatus Hydrogenedentes bacterium]|nr:hypothetical protein [Candidatus Hydrogenedentota bacterium]